MIFTIIQGLWKEGTKKNKNILKVLVAICGHRAMKGMQQEKKKLLWRWLWPLGTLKNLDCVLKPQAYLHY